VNVLVAALLLSASTLQAPRPAPIVTVADGRLLGTQEPDGRVLFRGIPFAAPPTGPRRWRPPAPAKPWRGIRDARASAPSCPQLDEGWCRYQR